MNEIHNLQKDSQALYQEAVTLLESAAKTSEQIQQAAGLLQTASDQGHARSAFRLALMYDNGELGKPDKQKARKLYEKAVEFGHAGATFNLALMYYKGELGEPDKQKARELYEKAVERGHAEATFNLALMYYNGELGEPGKQKARELYEKAVELGHAAATFNLALMYYNGELGEPDKQKARELFEKAAELGHAGAAFNLALIYDNGELGEPDKQKARKFYEKAVEFGDAGATFNLALMHYKGELGEPDKQKARELFEKAAELGDAGATNNLALMYYNGELGELDKQKAHELFEKALELGDAGAAFNLALMYDNGELGEPDKQKARELYEKALEFGDAGAANNLALMYDNGELGEPDKQKARELFEKAIEHGDVRAAFNLGGMYVEGVLGKRNYLKARKLFEMASKSGLGAASRALGLMHLEGHGGDANIELGTRLLKLAVEQGDQRAEALMPNPLIHQLGRRLAAKQEVAQKLRQEIIAALKAIEKQSNAICGTHLIKKKQDFSHFTDWAALEKILPVQNDGTLLEDNRNVLRQYHVDYMNDPTEGMRLLSFSGKNQESEEERTAQEVSSKLRDIFDQYYRGPTRSAADCNNLLPSVFITSLTRDSDRLDLWRAYGRDGSGYCISFEVDAADVDSSTQQRHLRAGHLEFLEKDKQSEERTSGGPVADAAPLLYAIKYQDADVIEALKLLDEPLKKIQRLHKKVGNPEIQNEIYTCVAAILLELLYLYKDEQYSTEREVRAIRIIRINDGRVKSDERNPGRLYVETHPFLFRSPTRIIIGPKVADKMPALWNLRWRLTKLGYADKTCVQMSDVQYR